MFRFCIVGGPSAGKSSVMKRLIHNDELISCGYHIFVVPETATELIVNGIKPCKDIPLEKFQAFVLEKQLAKEKIYEKLIDFYDTDKIVIFYDRGIMDACAYVDKQTVFKPLLESKGLSFADVYAHYDAVFHLVTAADGAEEFYQWNNPDVEEVGNNEARSESPAEAIIKDRKTLDAWQGHPCLRVFDNSTDFEGKVKRVTEEVFKLLGEVPLLKNS